MTKAASVIKAEPHEASDGWWGIHYDNHGFERERRLFARRQEARNWVKAQKAKESVEAA